MAEARELFHNWEQTKNRDLIRARLERAERIYGRGWQAFKSDWVAPKANPADRVRLTVALSNEPDPQLLKIMADAKNATPMPDFVRQFAQKVKGKA